MKTTTRQITGFMRGFLPFIASGLIVFGIARSLEDRIQVEVGKEKIERGYVEETRTQEDALKEKNYKTIDFSGDDNKTLMARVVFGEARDERVPYWEKVAVAYSILTRKDDGLPYNGEGSIRNVIFCPYGYSCLSNRKWNEENLMAIKDPETYDKESWQKALEIADGVLSGKLMNPIPGANLYDLKGCNPKWLKSKKVTRLPTPKNFKHNFYREK